MTIPNMLSIGRMILIPFFVTYFLGAQGPRDYFVAAGIVLLSGITDILDGFIARRFNMCSKLGKILDPAADKLTLFAVCACLWMRYPDVRMFCMMFVGKEVIMAIASLFLLRRNRDLDGAKWFGKLYTIVFYVTAICTIIDFRPMASTRFYMLGFMAVFTLFSFGMYIPVFFRQLKPGENKPLNDRLAS